MTRCLTFSIEDVRAYIHANDDTNAPKIEEMLRRGDMDNSDWFEEGAWDYLVSSMTPQYRQRIIDRMVNRSKARYEAGFSQIFAGSFILNDKNFYWLQMLSGGACDNYRIPKCRENIKATKAWFGEELNKQFRALPPEHMASAIVREADNYRFAHDERRRIEDRIIAATACIAYADRAPHPLLRHKASLNQMQFAYARCMFDLVTIKR